MLRKALLAFALVVLAASGLAALAGAVGAWVPFCWGAIIAIAIVVERFRYKPLTHEVPGSGWERTTERFIDDESGRPVTVYIEKTTGERQYVKE